MSPLSVIILAAGAGTRMRSTLPKVLHPVAGKPILAHIVSTAQRLHPAAIHVVYGHGGEQVKAQLADLSLSWVEQVDRLGTGHAVQQAIPFIPADHQVLILNGDVPLIHLDTLKALLAVASLDTVSLVTAKVSQPFGLGRIIRDTQQAIVGIVEEKDANEAQKALREINSGIISCGAAYLKTLLSKLKSNNNQKEYYLTDIIALAQAEGRAITSVYAQHEMEVAGINDKHQLATVERYYQSQQALKLLEQGVSIADPARLEIRGTVEVGCDLTLDINVILEGEVSFGDHCQIGPHVVIKNSKIGNHVKIEAFSVLENATVADHCTIGPFARLRPHTVLEEHAKIGNFVEIKKSTIGPGTKVNHLSYIGDATLGQGVNIGAGTITCNYDGVNKWPTQIEDGAFIGSGTELVAPIHIGKNATVGAGSTLSTDVLANSLTFERGPVKSVQEWARPQKKSIQGD